MVANTENSQNQDLIGFIWSVADKLRGPYRPHQYRRVMLPLIVLRRLDAVLEPTKKAVLEARTKYEAMGLKGDAFEKAIAKVAIGGERTQPLYNLSEFTFPKLLDDADGIASNLIKYINSFSPKARDIFEKFEFESEIQKLDENNRLYLIIKEFCKPELDLSPAKISNLQMGYLFEELVRKFNEQANEEAGDHFTPREVIKLMVNLVFCEEKDIFKQGIYRTVYDPTAGTGGMLSVAEEYIKKQNPEANLGLFGQEYNSESYAICCSDLLIKDEPINNLVYGDTLGVKNAKSKSNNFLPHDGHPGKQFHYMFANPPFGVEWKPEEDFVKDEYESLGFNGRFGAGLPRINDGSLLFLQHKISKMHPSPENGGDGSRIAIVFNGSPLFTGDAGSGESNIRRWIIENDWLDAVVALPDQMFYNTGIFTYIWLVTNKKADHRQGKVQLIDATHHYQKMKKSLGNKRNELSDAHIIELVRLYGDCEQNGISEVQRDGQTQKPICSKIFNNREFGFLKITIERPLRLNFQGNEERLARLWEQTAFQNLATTKKRKDEKVQQLEILAGENIQSLILDALQKLDGNKLYLCRNEFEKDLNRVLKNAGLNLKAPVKKAILAALGEADPDAEICKDSKGNPEADSNLRDTEIVPLPDDIALPLPLGYDKDGSADELIKLVKRHCEEYLKKEVLPHVPDAWIDFDKTKVGYEIPLNRHFYIYQPPRALDAIEDDIKSLESDIMAMLGEVV
ncbi:type I restriction-modification system subunit M [Dolichospermum sp. ST_sed1]|nr:type I restriction-modification system subunit M [Dolichospermum sp. ST_sed1]MDD1427469.1 type I restriction-modification system subunit M [Dolichospermum sp. ST_sed9]MDD1433908.1 type I restriction-modification system subunit M [Dolichospermum sp. ST_sed6]MDD1443262.1 type I restriction-modification system subunit M [Dolichospermum sp. ST_sed3]MDD1448923.1 type I restriction-modification system subunit M [Dolichospermum sp. ST_sed8]MDD1457230.1 type I restriction-modification system subuni